VSGFKLSELQALEHAAVDAALIAGEYIARYDRSRLEVLKKQGGDSLASQVVTEVDRESEALIKSSLNRVTEQFELAWLAEESALDIPINEHPRFTKRAFWCVDPLDGTLPFIEGSDGYAVSISLISKEGVPLLGVVYHPESKTFYRTSFSVAEQPVSDDNVLTFFTDRSLLQQSNYDTIKNNLNEFSKSQGFKSLEIHSGYGAVMNAVMVLTTPNSFYLKPPKEKQGGGSLWDFAATTALFQSARKPCGDFNGSTINFNQRDTLFMNQTGVLFAYDADLFSTLLRLDFTKL
jgi:3'(2'), 5'-bisphosphate nucleotidase/myo-inositol-1(or 4)-monophosphatase